MQKIYKVNSAWPHLSNIVSCRVFGVLKEHIKLGPHFDCMIIPGGHSYIKQGHKVDLLAAHHLIHLIRRVGVLVNSEDSLVLHVV